MDSSFNVIFSISSQSSSLIDSAFFDDNVLISPADAILYIHYSGWARINTMLWSMWGPWGTFVTIDFFLTNFVYLSTFP